MSTEKFDIFVDNFYYLCNLLCVMKECYRLIPANYNELLPDLKARAFRWELKYSSHTEIKTAGKISYYSINQTNRCIVLIPGLASNTQTEPLMKVLMYWALTHQYDVYCINTFLGNFIPEKTKELAERHTFSEYVSLIDRGLEKIAPECAGRWACIVGHSAGATAMIEIYNNRILNNQKLRFSASVLFAPYLCDNFVKFVHSFYKKHSYNNKISHKEFLKAPLGLISPHEVLQNKCINYVTVLPTIFSDIASVQFRPDIMEQYTIPVTLVAGGRDKKSPPHDLRKKFNVLKTGKNAALFSFVNFKNSKHSFINQHHDTEAIINLIKSLRVKSRNK